MNQWIRLRRKKFKLAWICTFKSENKTCWCFYVFFDLVVISSVLTTLFVYCSIADLIEGIYFQKCSVKQTKKIEISRYAFQKNFFRDTNLADSSTLSKSGFANLNLKKLWFKSFGTSVLIFDMCNPLRSSKL